MAESPRAVAVIDAENRAKQVLLNAASDVARYQASVNNAAIGVARATQRIDRVQETTYRKIIRFTADATELIEEQVHTVEDQLVPAYNAFSDAGQEVAYAEAQLAHQLDGSNRQFSERADLLEKLARASIPGRLTDSTVGDATGSDEAGSAAGAIVTAGFAASRAAPAVGAYRNEIAASGDATRALGAATRAAVAPLTTMGRVGRVLTGVFKNLVVIVVSLPMAFTAARAAGMGFFGSMIAGVRALTAALLASPLMPYVLAILAIVAAVKAGIAIFKLFREEIMAGAAKAFAPWIEWWTTFKREFIQELAPIITVAVILFGALGSAIMFVMNNVVLPAVKIAGEAVLTFMRVFNHTLLNIIDVVLGVAQVFLDQIFNFVNHIRVAWGVISSENLSLSEKFKLLWKLIINYTLDGAGAVIKLFFELLSGVGRIVVGGVNSILFIWLRMISAWNEATGGMVEKTLRGLMQFIRTLVNVFTDSLNWLIRVANQVPGVTIPEINAGSFMNSIDQVVGSVSHLFDTMENIKSVQQMVESGFGIDPSVVTQGLDTARDAILGALQNIKDRFGIDLQDIADSVDVELLTAPDLRAGFKAILDKTKLKLELLGMEELTDKIDQVNSREQRVEINPLIQLYITEDVDEERARRILLPIIDEALLAGAQKMGQQVFSANVGNA